MNHRDAEEFLDNLESPLRQSFSIPRRSPRKARNDVEMGPPTTSSIQDPVKNIEEQKYQKSPTRGFDSKFKRMTASESLPDYPSYNPESAPQDKKDPLGLDAKLTYGDVKGERYGIDQWKEMYDGDIPMELDEKCRVARCDLCDIDFSSPIVAKSHYVGNKHRKQVQTFLESWSARTGLPMPRRKADMKLDISGEGFVEDESFCSLCKVSLSSKVVALSHYQGKQHAKNIRKSQAGLPVGKVMTEDPTGRFGIGEALKPPEEPRPQAPIGDEGDRQFMCYGCNVQCMCEEQFQRHNASFQHAMNCDEPTKRMIQRVATGGYRCVPCDVQVSSFETLCLHMHGAKHKKKVSGAPMYAIPLPPREDEPPTKKPKLQQPVQEGEFRCEICQVSCNSQDILDAHLNGKKHQKKIGFGGGAAGKDAGKQNNAFVCELCNVATNSQELLQTHFNGRKHQKKLTTG